MTSAHRYAADALQAFCTRLFAAKGLPEADARAVAACLVRSEMRGWRTHALSRTASYVQMIDEGLFNPRPAITHERRPGALIVEADAAMGQVAARDVLALGRAELAASASVLVSVRGVGHLGSLGLHALAAAEAGLFCLVGQHTPPLLALEGFTRGAIGNNPLAFACPVAGHDPLVFDMAASQAARGHILLAAREGRPIPDGWAIGDDGAPTTDAKRALQGALLPAGGAKGVGIAMLVQVLAASLAATAETAARPHPELRATGGTAAVGAFFWFVDPGAFGGRAAFDESMGMWTSYYRESGPDGVARLPGARGADLERVARASGLSLVDATERDLRSLGQRLGVAFPQPL